MGGNSDAEIKSMERIKVENCDDMQIIWEGKLYVIPVSAHLDYGFWWLYSFFLLLLTYVMQCSDIFFQVIALLMDIQHQILENCGINLMQPIDLLMHMGYLNFLICIGS